MALKRSTFSSLATKFLNDSFADFAKVANIEELVTVEDGQGGRSESWSQFAEIKCFVFPMAGTENLQSGRYFTDQDFKFSFKPVDGVTTKMRINYDGSTYGIMSIKDIVDADVWIEAITEINSPQ